MRRRKPTDEPHRPVVLDTTPLPRERQDELALAAQKGDKRAMDLLVGSNMAWIWRQARRNRGPLDPEDAFHEAILGFMRAVEKYDPTRSTIQTYSILWIRSYLQAAAARTGAVKVWGTSSLRAARAALYKMAQERDCTPLELLADPAVVAQIAEHSGNSEETISSLAVAFAGKIGGDLSANGAWQDGPRCGTLGGLLGEHQPDALDEAIEREKGELVWRALDLLREEDPRAARIVSRALESPPSTLEALAGELGLSRERVRQLEVRGKNRLRELYRVVDAGEEGPKQTPSRRRLVGAAASPPPVQEAAQDKDRDSGDNHVDVSVPRAWGPHDLGAPLAAAGHANAALLL